MMECRCVSLLQQGGPMHSNDLRKAAGTLPHYVRSGVSTNKIAFKAFISARPHLFCVSHTGDGPRVVLATGECFL